MACATVLENQEKATGMTTPKKQVTLTVLVPAYNEESTIRKILDRLLSQPLVTQIIVVNDASTDRTGTIVRGIKDKRLTLITHKKNMGKGKAIQTGLQHATGKYVLIQDADMEYDPGEIHLLLEPIRTGRAEIVYGSRFFGAHTNMFFWHYVGNQLLNLFVNVLYNSIVSDMETCYKLVPTTLLRSLDLQENDFRIEPEITCKILQKKNKIFEVPITYVGRTYEEGKKITWIDWFYAVGTIFRIRFLG